jgi:hypothetical protein
MTKVYEMTPGMHQGDHAFASPLQSLELLQRFYDPKTHKVSAEEASRGMIAEARVAIGTRGRASPEDYRAMAKQSRAAGITADDQFLYEDLPAIMIAWVALGPAQRSPGTTANSYAWDNDQGSLPKT